MPRVPLRYLSIFFVALLSQCVSGLAVQTPNITKPVHLDSRGCSPEMKETEQELAQKDWFLYALTVTSSSEPPQVANPEIQLIQADERDAKKTSIKEIRAGSYYGFYGFVVGGKDWLEADVVHCEKAGAK